MTSAPPAICTDVSAPPSKPKSASTVVTGPSAPISAKWLAPMRLSALGYQKPGLPCSPRENDHIPTLRGSLRPPALDHRGTGTTVRAGFELSV